VDTAPGTNNELRALAEGFYVFTDRSTTNTGKELDVHVITEGHDVPLNLQGQFTSMGDNETLAGPDIRINLLQSGD
jgi:hypothetical protein